MKPFDIKKIVAGEKFEYVNEMYVEQVKFVAFIKECLSSQQFVYTKKKDKNDSYLNLCYCSLEEAKELFKMSPVKITLWQNIYKIARSSILEMFLIAKKLL